MTLWRGVLAVAVLLGPSLVFMVGAYGVPLANVFLLSVGYPDLTGTHLAEFFRQPAYLTVLRTTFVMSGLITLVCAVLGYPAAYLLATASPRARTALLVAILLPFTTSMLVRTYAWMALLGREGLANQVILALGLSGSPLKLMHNAFGVVVGMVHVMLPLMILSIYSVMRNIDLNLCRAAETLGATPLVSHFRIFLPLSMPGINAGVLLVFMLSIGFYVTPALLGSTRDIWISMLIEMQVNQVLNWEFAAAIAAILLACSLVLYVVYVKLFGYARLGHAA